MKIAVIDDGVDAKHEFFDPDRLHVSDRLPEGPDEGHDAEGDRAAGVPGALTALRIRVVRPSTRRRTDRSTPPTSPGSPRATTTRRTAPSSCPASRRTRSSATTRRSRIPTPGFGLDGNSAQIAAAIEAAVSDGMNVINLSLGEPEISPSRDFVVHAIEAAAQAGVVPVIAADNQFDEYGYGSISSPANAPSAITVAATTLGGTIADFSSGGPTPVSLQLKPDVAAPGVAITSSLPVNQAGPVRRDVGNEHGGAAGLRRGGAADAAAPRLDGRADQVGARPDRRSRAGRQRPGGLGAPRGRRADRPRPRRRSPAVRGARRRCRSRSTAAPCRSTSPMRAAARARGRSPRRSRIRGPASP